MTEISIHALLAESDREESGQQRSRHNFYPRSPCGERPWSVNNPPSSYTISIHALLAESDHYGWSWYDDFTISIHALLAESDVPVDGTLFHQTDFYPRSPCGERRRFPPDTGAQEVFLSTLSLRRATYTIHRP